MPKIGLDKAEPGMVVAENVISPQGRMLLGEGFVLTDKYIRILKTWGVNALVIEGEEEIIASIPLPPEVLQQAKERVSPIFRKSNTDHPVVAHLLRARIETKAREIVTQSKEDSL